MTNGSLREFARKIPGARALAMRLDPLVRGLVSWLRNAAFRLSPVNWPATERGLLALLRRRIVNRIRHDWSSPEPPHFSYTNYNALAFSYFERMPGPGILLRGFISAQMVRPGDRVLDLGCGDGFFSKRFLAIEAAHVDAVDIDAEALSFAQLYNSDPKVTFHLLDAVRAPFPGGPYDLVVWDGAIGHFSPDTTEAMFRKIKSALKKEGVFCGSEQLGRVAAADHLQHWETLEDVRRMLAPHFRFIAVRAVEYFYDLDRAAKRGEFYWRASDARSALERADFRIFEGSP
jgi:SAM-dependent methyltransferase